MWMHLFDTIKELCLEVSNNDVWTQLVFTLQRLISMYGDGLFEETWECLITKVIMFIFEKSVDNFI